jgi:hypothetical protein
LQKITEELDTVVLTLNAVMSSGDSSKKNVLNAVDQGQGDSKIWEHEIGTYQMVSQKLVFYQPVMPNVKKCDKITGKGKT